MVQSRGVLRGTYNDADGTFSLLDSDDYDDGVDEEMHPEDVRNRQRDILCSVLGTIKEKCFMPNLRRCYVGHDLNAHLAFLMESLKVSATRKLARGYHRPYPFWVGDAHPKAPS